MFIDARNTPRDEVIEADICIIGSGAVGTTIAREFIGSKTRVVVLESGGYDFDEANQALNGGKVSGVPYFPLTQDRLRVLGGATQHWGGHCQPLMPIDMEQRSGMAMTGWPIRHSDLIPFYERASSIVEIGEYARFSVNTWEEAKRLHDVPRPQNLPKSVIPKIYQVSPPTHFGEVYRDELEAAQNVRVFLHANFVGVDRDGDRVVAIDAKCLNGNQFKVKARLFVLGAGTMQNARLLLAVKDQDNRPLSDNAMVGRCFQEHPAFIDVAELHPSDDDQLLARHAGGKIEICAGLSEELLKRDRALNANIWFDARPVGGESEGVRSMRKIRRGEWEASDVLNVLTDLGSVFSYARQRNNEQATVGIYYITFSMEQAPNTDSYIALSNDKDALGLPLLDFHWAFNDLDRHSLLKNIDTLAHQVSAARAGRVRSRLNDDASNMLDFLKGSHHHMGTTRMSDDPTNGVVNANLLLHGAENFYVGGGSVFPTSGAASPTYTIVALSLRLADHLKTRLIT